jgi:hypothetical protein
VLVASLVVLAVVLAGALVLVGRASPRETADRFLAALQDKNVAAAHDLLCRDGKRKETVAELRDDFELGDHTITSYRITGERTREREGKEETLVTATLTYETGDRLSIDIGVWTEGGNKVCSLSGPSPTG